MKLAVSYTSTSHLLRVVLNRSNENGRVETPVVATSSPQRLIQLVDLCDDGGLVGVLVERLDGIAVGAGAADAARSFNPLCRKSVREGLDGW